MIHSLRRACFLAWTCICSWATATHAAPPAEPLLRNLPFGVSLRNSIEAPADQVVAIGKKLGGEIERISNSQLQVQGRAIQVNFITAKDEASAQAIHAALLKIKPYPFCQRHGLRVVEFVIRDADEALAIKTSYELGLLDKPKRVRYRLTAELATINTADYMACNPLFNHFLELRGGRNAEIENKIAELAKKFTFGRTLVLRNPKLADDPATHQFQPDAKTVDEQGNVVVYAFDELPARLDVPYVKATLELTVDDTGLTRTTNAPAEDLTAATTRWPVDDPAVQKLARQITAGKTTNTAKAEAILDWLTPGKNINYSGQTGSRWGVEQVLKQKFGHCWDFSDCFVSLARAAGVPSRQVAGWLYGSSGHVWAEYHREGTGWQQVDPTAGGKLPCGIYHLPYFSTETGEMPIVYLSMPKIEVVNE